jgi:ABC-2 type transport system permease protein
MTHIIQVFRYEFLRNIRRRGFLFATFGIPVLALVLLFGYQGISQLTAGDAEEDPAEAFDFEGIESAGYVDFSGLFSEIPPQLSEFVTRYDDEATAQAALQAEEIDVYYLIPADYMESGVIDQVVSTFSLDVISSGPIREVIMHTLTADIDPSVYQRLVDPSTIEAVNLSGLQVPDGVGPQGFDSKFLLVYVFAIALMLGLFMTNGYLMQGVIEEKETRIIEILISSLRPAQLLIGKILAFGLMGILQMLVWLAVFVLVLQFADVLTAISVLASIYLPLDILPLVLVYFVLAYMFFATAYGMVGAISSSAQEGPQYAIIFTLPAALPLYFIGLFIETPDAAIPVILSLVPITAPLSMTMRLLTTTVPFWQIALSIALLVITIVGLMWLAGRFFRVQTLLAGQTPKLRDLPRLIRG